MLYRIYEIDLSERVVAPPRNIICDSDEEAAREAKQLVDTYDLELRQGGRIVIRLPHMSAWGEWMRHGRGHYDQQAG
jgi:hypothetical protein